MAKSPEAFRTISEVAKWLGTPTHVLRFWESRFSQIKPVKRAGGRRYYRPKDMELLGGIKKLLHDDGMTIRGVQKLLREEGVRHVARMSPPIEPGAELTPDGAIEAEAVKPPARPGHAQEATPPEEAPMAEDVPQEAIDNVVAMNDAETAVPEKTADEKPAQVGPRGDVLPDGERPVTSYRAAKSALMPDLPAAAPGVGETVPDDPDDEDDTDAHVPGIMEVASALRRANGGFGLHPKADESTAKAFGDIYKRLVALRDKMDESIARSRPN